MSSTPPDDFHQLLHGLRRAPTPADPADVARGFEARVAARLAAERGNNETYRWFARWSCIFGLATALCLAGLFLAYRALADDAFAAFDQTALLFDWLQ